MRFIIISSKQHHNHIALFIKHLWMSASYRLHKDDFSQIYAIIKMHYLFS